MIDRLLSIATAQFAKNKPLGNIWPKMSPSNVHNRPKRCDQFKAHCTEKETETERYPNKGPDKGRGSLRQCNYPSVSVACLLLRYILAPTPLNQHELPPGFVRQPSTNPPTGSQIECDPP
ncbi:hypothetical protein J3459_009867 [Metarhizium acridum]|uniref:uncharacterized protein n=1 Tax=Metarhizium acridum TaxID=92637 RepID=UPI001C6AE894|nr:hypothetical protein J3459_009867 [Metarhizium acridum]KAG8424778.1 hypothetical protein J3458_001542 [Metarhizium acridum]